MTDVANVTDATAELRLNDEPAGESTETGEVTVLENKENFTVKHPLNSSWTLWYLRPQMHKGEAWSNLLKEVVSFSSVEEFWGIYDSIPKVTELPLKSDYQLFRTGIKPEWEDPANSAGGKWSYQFRRDEVSKYDDAWLRAMLSVIGETIEQGEDNEVTGVVVSVRKAGVRFGLWTKTSDKAKLESSLIAIGHTFKKVLNLSENDRVDFISHADAEKSGGKTAPLISV